MRAWILLILAATLLAHAAPMKTTPPVIVTLDGFTLEQWAEQTIWNQTRGFIVHHLNAFCKKDRYCDAEYGVENIHLLHAMRSEPSSIRLNVTADEPILSVSNGNPFSYNYTALLTGALFQAKIDIEHLHDNQHSNRINYSSTPLHTNMPISRTSRLLLILLGIGLVAVVFALTILFFQRVRQHRYTKLLKPTAISQPAQDD